MTTPCTPQGLRTPILDLCKPQSGEVNWSSALNGDLDTLDALFMLAKLLKPLYGGLGLDASAAPSGAIPIGKGDGFALAIPQAGTGIVITPSAGGLIIATSGSPAGGSIFTAGALQGSGNGVDYSTISATFVDVDAANLKATVTVPGAAKFIIVQATFCVGVSPAVTGVPRVQILAAGIATAIGAITDNAVIDPQGVYTVYGVAANPPSGSQTIALQFRGDGSNAFVIKNQFHEGNVSGIPRLRARLMYTVTN